MNQVNGCEQIDNECLPTRSDLRVIRESDPNHGLSDDEISDRDEFIRCYIMSEFESLLSVPKPESDFFVENFEESAFNTNDFDRMVAPFNKKAYAIKEIMERVKDLAIIHSCISSEEGRLNTQRRYEALVDKEFRDRLLGCVKRYNGTVDWFRKRQVKSRVAQLNGDGPHCLDSEQLKLSSKAAY